jgi:copper chaperone NosL
MGAEETVPFSTREAATQFAASNGGSVVTFGNVPRDYVLGAGAETGSPAADDGKMETEHHG